jgi:hypothetical protein
MQPHTTIDASVLLDFILGSSSLTEEERGVLLEAIERKNLSPEHLTLIHDAAMRDAQEAEREIAALEDGAAQFEAEAQEQRRRGQEATSEIEQRAIDEIESAATAFTQELASAERTLEADIEGLAQSEEQKDITAIRQQLLQKPSTDTAAAQQ